MAQQYPQWQPPPQTQFMPGMGAPMPSQTAPQGLPGADPRLQAMVAQALQNPDMADAFSKMASTLPSDPAQLQQLAQNPAALANLLAQSGMVPPGQDPAALASMIASGGVPGAGNEPPEPFQPLGSPQDMLLGGALGAGVGLGITALDKKEAFIKAASFIDKKIPLMGRLNAFLENKVLPRLKGKPGLDELTMQHALNQPNAPEAVKNALYVMEQRQIGTVLKPFKNTVDPAAYRRLKAYKQIDASRLNGKHPTDFDKFIQACDDEIDRLKKTPSKGWWADWRMRSKLKNIRNQVKGMNLTYKPLFMDQARLTHQLETAGIKPVGRMFATGAMLVRRLFSGETVMDGMGLGKAIAEQPSKNIVARYAGKLLGPLINGVLSFGTAFSAARKAKDGEKVQTFCHELFGGVIGGMIGFELGQKVANAARFRSILGRFAGLRLLRPLPLLGRITLGGFLGFGVSLVAGAILTKVFAGISHMIFGTPSEESLNGQGQKPKQPPSIPGQPVRASRIAPSFQLPPKPPKLEFKPLSTLTPEEISQSASAKRRDTELQQIQNAAELKEKNIFLPFGTPH